MSFDPSCQSPDHFTRRTLLKAAGFAGASWLTPLAERLARAADEAPKGTPAKSVIVLWMEGGPSHHDTFDPHPGAKKISFNSTKAIKTRSPDIEISDLLPQVAEHMDRISLVRAVTSKEGDHERATYNIKTGYRPDPTLIHPSLGAILCQQTTDNCEIPRHVAIMPGPWPARGGFLGDQFDAFKTYDPNGPIPDIRPRVPQERADRRLDDLQNVVETAFVKRRLKDLDKKTLHATSIKAARRMMSSDQIKAFDVSGASDELKKEFGDTGFGRACLAAVQLIETGVRCVEVNLGSWDSHLEQERFAKDLCGTLDPAYAALMKQLKDRNLIDSTVVLWGGEFGRTPQINPAGGRDHWPHGFTIALAGGGIQGGRVIGATSDDPKLNEADRLADLTDPHPIEDIHATVLHALGIDFTYEYMTPIGRPMAFSKGKVIDRLLA